MPENEIECWTFAGWEPDRQYARSGSRGASMFGNGAWLPAWRRRVVSRETVDLMRESGITTAITHFYKGFGVRAESAEWPRLREFTALCHEGGIKVWGYVQGTSLYYETLLAEVPEAMDWAARGYDGRPLCWGSHYYRLAPCLNAGGYLEYMCRVIRTGLEDLGLDGIHNDNSYYRHCWCERCTRLFRAWLAGLPDLEKRLGLPGTDHVLPPPINAGLEKIGDPLVLAWLEFGAQTRLAAYGSFYRTVKACRPDAVYETNPAFPRAVNIKARLAFDPAREGRVCDAVCAENDNLPRVEPGGRIYGQAEAYLHGDAGGYRVISTSWLEGKPARRPGMLWAGLAEEFSHHAAFLGNNWLLRPAGDGAVILGDEPEPRDAHAAGVTFFRGLHRSLAPGRRRQWAEVGLLVDTDTLTVGGARDHLALRAALAWFVAGRIPVRFIYDTAAVPGDIRVLAVCRQSCLAGLRLAELSALGARGVAVLLAGPSGRWDEWAVARNESDWRAWRAGAGFTADNGAELDWWEAQLGEGLFQAAAVRFSAACDRDLRALLADCGWRPRFAADLPSGALVNTETAEDGRLLVHLREQAGTGEPVSGGTVRLAAALRAGRGALMHAPGRAPATLAGAGDGDLRLEVPAFRHYALLEIR